MADGLSFYNDQDGEVTNLTAENTQDDALAFVNFTSGPNYTGGSATNIRIASYTGSIHVAGQSDVTISNFSIATTSAPGVVVKILQMALGFHRMSAYLTVLLPEEEREDHFHRIIVTE